MTASAGQERLLPICCPQVSLAATLSFVKRDSLGASYASELIAQGE
jgi:hypothetical protein